MITACALAARCPLLLAPAMNGRMYEHPATQANIELLRDRGAHVVGPDSGRLASIGEQGVGRLAEPAQIARVCGELIARRSRPCGTAFADQRRRHPRADRLGALRRQPLLGADGIRARAGRSGARRQRRRSSRPTWRSPRRPAQSAPTSSTAEELAEACRGRFARLRRAADGGGRRRLRASPARPDEKIKRAGREQPRADARADGRCARDARAARAGAGQTLVGFAAEHGEADVELAREKLVAKGIDAIVVNDISRGDIGFDSSQNEVTVIYRARRARGPRATGRQGGRRRRRARRRNRPRRRPIELARMDSAYDLYHRGCALLGHGDHRQRSSR